MDDKNNAWISKCFILLNVLHTSTINYLSCNTAGFSGPGRGRGRAEIAANSISSQATVEKTDVKQEIIFCSRAAKMMAKSEHSTAQHRRAQ